MFKGKSTGLVGGLIFVLLPVLMAGQPALAGEIVIGAGVSSKGKPAASASSSGSEAGRQRDAARDYRKGQVAAEVLLLPGDEEGVLSPRQEIDTAEDSVQRAREARQGDAGQGTVLVPLGPDSGRVVAGETAAAQNARKNREKAAAYRKGGASSALGVTGNEALPIVDCSNVESTAGRIGDDDARSGSVITLIQGRNQVKVRCR